MHRVAALGLATLMIVPSQKSDSPETVRSPPIKAMSFNLRYASETDDHPWSKRKDALVETVRRADPDLLGTQEGLFRQLEDIANALPHLAWVGLGRRGGSHDEYCAIFYRRDRFLLKEYDHFWLSERPSEIGSRSYDADLPRMVTWVRLRERATDRDLVVINTHFDNAHELSRARSADQLRKFVETLDPELPILVTGDFNAPAGSGAVHDELVGRTKLEDLIAAGGVGDDEGSFHGFTGATKPRGRIDWILGRGVTMPKDASVVRDAVDGIFPSDHFPVVVSVTLR